MSDAMTIFMYLGIFAFSGFALFLAEKQRAVWLKILLYALVIALPSALLSLRFSATGDYNSYRFIANAILTIEEPSQYLAENGIEPTFHAITLLSNWISGSWHLVFVIYGTLTALIGFIGVKLWCPDKRWLWAFWLIWLMIIFPNGFNLIRQALAFTIAFIGLWFLYKKNRWLTALIVTLIACTFHVSAIFFLVLFVARWFSQSKNKVRTLLILLIIGGCGLAVLAFAWQYIPAKYIGYFTDSHWRQGRTWFSLIRMAFLICVFGVSYIERHNRSTSSDVATTQRVSVPDFVSISTVLSFVFTLPILPSPLSRMADFLWVFFLWWLFETTQKINTRRDSRIFWGAMALLLCVAIFIGVEYMYNYHGMFPYNLITTVDTVKLQ